MSAEQHDADAYGQELARISQHQSEGGFGGAARPGPGVGPGAGCERGPGGGAGVHVGLDRPRRLPRPGASEEILAVALSAVGEDERAGYAQA